MSLLRPTLQGRAGFDPKGFGGGVNAPFGRSADYPGYHNGQDYFWLGSTSARQLNISTAASKNIYPVKSGALKRVDSGSLGLGMYQQLDSSTRAYYWHLSSRLSNGTYDTNRAIGVMGHTGSAAGSGDHLHFEVRKAPYGFGDRVDPEPYFKALTAAQKTRHKKIAAFLNPHAVNVGLPKTTTASDGVPGPNYWKLLQAVARAWGFYGGTVDGKPGNLTYSAEARLWSDYVNKPKPVPAPEPAPEPEPAPALESDEPPVEPVEPEPVEPDPVEPEPVEPQPTPEPDWPVEPVEPVPSPATPSSPPEAPKEYTMPTVPVPATPDIILPANVRAGLYLGNWSVGVAIAATAAGVLAIDAPVHPALVATIAVYGVLSSAISGLARANTTTVKKTS